MARLPNEAELVLIEDMRALGIYTEAEWKFHPTRKWRFDAAEYRQPKDIKRRPKIACEVEGAVFSGGRHTRGAGFIKDLEKYNEAMILGWIVFRFTPQMVLKGEAKEVLRRWLNANS